MRDKIFGAVWGGLVAGWALLVPIQGIMLALGALVVADFVTGVWKSIRKRHPITSRGWRSTIGKIAIYLVAVIAGFACDYIINNDTPIIARAISVAIALTEIKSIMENFYAVTGINLVKLVVDKFKPQIKTPEEEARDKPPVKKRKKRPIKR